MCRSRGAALAIIMLLGVIVSTRAQELELDDVVRKSGVWKLTPDDFEAKYAAYKFEWTAADKGSARSVAPELEFQDLQVIEALAYFKKGKLSGFTFLLYSRGDKGRISSREFNGMVEDAMTTISDFMRSKPRDLKNFGTGGTDKEERLWTLAHLALQLEWSISYDENGDKQPEYLRLRAFEAEDGKVSLSRGSQGVLYSRQLRENITRKDDMTYLANIPMVDQGEKGYCAVAVCERILRYYQRDIDQHELAEIAKSEDGTSLSALMDGLKKSGSKLGVRTEQLDEMTFKRYEQMVDDYNRAAKKNEAIRELPSGSNLTRFEPLSVLASMDAETLRDGRMTRRSSYETFMSNVKQNVDQGYPLLWGVMLGIVPEENYKGGFGLHLRLIIGYSKDGEQIVYSDTWGAGHEFKQMSSADAWAITTSMMVMKPQ